MKFLDSEQKRQIGLEYILNQLDIKTHFGYELIKSLRPYKRNEKELLEKELDELEVIIENYKQNKLVFDEIEGNLSKLKDIRNSIKRCKGGHLLDEVELYEIKNFCFINEKLNELITCLNLDFIYLNSLKEIYILLDPEGNNLPTFHIYDSYSNNLKAIREKKRELEKRIFIEHDEEVIKKLKEERLNIVYHEEEEELKVKKYLSEKIQKWTDKFNDNFRAIAKLDFLIAKAKVSIKYNGVKPQISDEKTIAFRNLINPEVMDLLKEKGKNYTPISIELNSGSTIITGANMGGKSVSLKTISLNLLLGHLGFYVLAEEAKFTILDFIYFISDDLQSVSRGLSTFGAEIIKLREVVDSIKSGTGFAALDEVARGTNPKEGFYIVKAIAKYLNKFSSFSVISTHFDGIPDEDMIHYQVVGLKNIDVESLKRKINLNNKNSVELIQEYMDYRLEKINSLSEVPKDALNISILLGLEEKIIDIAKKLIEEGEKDEKQVKS
ncbi:DNA mismatch repair protein MutS [Caloramator mitchellensis]|uniref:DNA mismatch repair protein MutS n=1 Tax=Caloramator mitchellensis TaxID=908809 RepID=A0A0R3K2V7_CALMK|nr:methionine ABC transporter substrate-binding protein [Caloramator mitchellensis]KRQ87902.1 DNA mismatch repair protein MutS [Caloramator mitchellensis]